MYKPQYLNVQIEVEELHYGSYADQSDLVDRCVTVTPLGYKKKPPEKRLNKSGRQFARK
ncbi:MULTISPECIES: hypothetical protein [unclassified Enterococcus]|uniref:hypothetical protein n=1 Tax=unclassified Enterococcus TaxID=2608891 RepID=UPI000B641319|nr:MULTISPECIES: hypothetical protein [unclassified Enterococcus]MBO0427269.1 hypothetical protein [Enterococcus faecium]OTO33315.1 hypothetical protein A5870_000661 [Enterococcus sp. 2G9_DIV0600]OTO36202.1 hypothetical protein A5871_000738 [Enterococcus sp. 2F9_DIV0599]